VYACTQTEQRSVSTWGKNRRTRTDLEENSELVRKVRLRQAANKAKLMNTNQRGAFGGQRCLLLLAVVVEQEGEQQQRHGDDVEKQEDDSRREQRLQGGVVTNSNQLLTSARQQGGWSSGLSHCIR
jgi:hypothetical protein